MAEFQQHDRNIIRDLAKQAAEIAAHPVQAARIGLWKRHNSLQSCRPMILVFPEGSWRELLPETLGAWHIDPVIHCAADLKRLRRPELVYDDRSTQAAFTCVRDLFGDILNMRFVGCSRISYHLMREMIAGGVLSLNNDNTYHNSGGNGWTDALPGARFDGVHVHPRHPERFDRWTRIAREEVDRAGAR